MQMRELDELIDKYIRFEKAEAAKEKRLEKSRTESSTETARAADFPSSPCRKESRKRSSPDEETSDDIVLASKRCKTAQLAIPESVAANAVLSPLPGDHSADYNSLDSEWEWGREATEDDIDLVALLTGGEGEGKGDNWDNLDLIDCSTF
jgi:hypothetical protein